MVTIFLEPLQSSVIQSRVGGSFIRVEWPGGRFRQEGTKAHMRNMGRKRVKSVVYVSGILTRVS